MAVTFAASKEINWASFSPSLNSMSAITMIARVNSSAFQASFGYVLARVESATIFTRLTIGSGGNVQFSKREGAANTNGFWEGTTSVMSTGTYYMMAATYDFALSTNDPVIYLNATSQTISEISGPTATGTRPNGGTLIVSSTASNAAMIGDVFTSLIYNRVLAASEIADIYASKQAIHNYRGLVFAANLIGAAGLQTFDGATLGASNTVADQVTGALGVPSGSPVGKADTVLIY